MNLVFKDLKYKSISRDSILSYYMTRGGGTVMKENELFSISRMDGSGPMGQIYLSLKSNFLSNDLLPCSMGYETIILLVVLRQMVLPN